HVAIRPSLAGPSVRYFMKRARCTGLASTTRMRACLLLAVSLLALACSSSKASAPDANNSYDSITSSDTSADISVDYFVGCPGGYPCCSFVDGAGAAAGVCNPQQCIVVVDGGFTNGCVTCPDGYFCAIFCPSANGGCGGAPTCCR